MWTANLVLGDLYVIVLVDVVCLHKRRDGTAGI
jgi:hypothetical protein